MMSEQPQGSPRPQAQPGPSKASSPQNKGQASAQQQQQRQKGSPVQAEQKAPQAGRAAPAKQELRRETDKPQAAQAAAPEPKAVDAGAAAKRPAGKSIKSERQQLAEALKALGPQQAVNKQYQNARREAAYVKRLDSNRFFEERLVHDYYRNKREQLEFEDFLRRGVSLEKAGRLEEACAHYQKALALRPASLELREYVARTIAEVNESTRSKRQAEALALERERQAQGLQGSTMPWMRDPTAYRPALLKGPPQRGVSAPSARRAPSGVSSRPLEDHVRQLQESQLRRELERKRQELDQQMRMLDEYERRRGSLRSS